MLSMVRRLSSALADFAATARSTSTTLTEANGVLLSARNLKKSSATAQQLSTVASAYPRSLRAQAANATTSGVDGRRGGFSCSSSQPRNLSQRSEFAANLDRIWRAARFRNPSIPGRHHSLAAASTSATLTARGSVRSSRRVSRTR